MTEFRFRLGQVVVTEGSSRSWVSRAVTLATGSRWTHCFIITGDDEGVEAVVPAVRRFSVHSRIQQLLREERSWLVLEPQNYTLAQRVAVARLALGLVGQRYAIRNALSYFFGRHFRFTMSDKATCGSLIAALFLVGCGKHLFDSEILDEHGAGLSYRKRLNLQLNHATPDDLVHRSALLLYDGWTA